MGKLHHVWECMQGALHRYLGGTQFSMQQSYMQSCLALTSAPTAPHLSYCSYTASHILASVLDPVSLAASPHCIAWSAQHCRKFSIAPTRCPLCRPGAATINSYSVDESFNLVLIVNPPASTGSHRERRHCLGRSPSVASMLHPCCIHAGKSFPPLSASVQPCYHTRSRRSPWAHRQLHPRSASPALASSVAARYRLLPERVALERIHPCTASPPFFG